MDNEIISYMEEQLPDIRDGVAEAEIYADRSTVDYLYGIIETYEHIIEKFGA
jgi:hypothetical protein